MKRILIIAILFISVSCKKEWKCNSTSVYGTHTSFDYRGTKSEMKQYEIDNTNELVTTECQ